MKLSLPHGEEGHCNIYTRDHDSVITGKGKHDRVCAFQPRCDIELNTFAVYVRIDHKWGLGMPTDEQVKDVMKKDQDIKGRWKKVKENHWKENNSTEQLYIKA